MKNMLPFFRMCLGTSWFLASDMHMFILGPLMIWPMWMLGSKMGAKAAGALGVVYLIASCAVPAGITAKREYPPINTFSQV